MSNKKPGVPEPADPAWPAPLVDLDNGGLWGPQTVALKRPFKFMGIEYRTATVRVPTGADVDAVPAGTSDQEVRALTVMLTGWPDEVFAVMSQGDRQAIWRCVGNLLAGVV